MLLPLLTITFVSFGSWAYIVRYFLINILKEDYISAKRTIGISKKRILYSHALRNAAPPIATSVALSLAASFGGSIIVEAVFDWPGMGKLYYDAIGVLDIPIIIGLTVHKYSNLHSNHIHNRYFLCIFRPSGEDVLMVISGLNLIKHLIQLTSRVDWCRHPDFFTESIGLWIIVCADYRLLTME